MRLLFTIPHYFDPAGDSRHSSGRAAPETRARALEACLLALRRNFGKGQGMIDIAEKKLVPANEGAQHEVDIVVHVTGKSHLLEAKELRESTALFERREIDVPDPKMLGFSCHETLRERLGEYQDFFCYLEDDLVCRDPWHFTKLRWFGGLVGNESLLQPNRFEVGGKGGARKVYIDGDLRPDVTAPFQSIEEDRQIRGQALGRGLILERALNPHSGCFFLNAEQMKHWAESPHFLDGDTRFIGPLESAATLGIMRAFKVYKPARGNASFFEIEHRDDAFIGLVRD